MYLAGDLALSIYVSTTVVEAPAGRGALGWQLVSDAELLERVAERDPRAWDELVQRFAGLVWSVARSFRLPQATTEDVVQTVWLRLAEHSTSIRNPERLAAWLATTTRNEALRSLRGLQRAVPTELFDDRSDETLQSLEEQFDDQQVRQLVLAAFRQLEAGCQQLLQLLCTVPPLDYQAIAEVLDRPVGSIGPTRARCLQRLRRQMESNDRTERHG